MREYRLISADSHINEPPDLWTSRLSEQFKARAPRIESFPQGDAYVMESALDPMNFGGNCSAGIPIDKKSAWIRWEDVRRGGYDPAARLLEQMEKSGLVSAMASNGNRELLVPSSQDA